MKVEVGVAVSDCEPDLAAAAGVEAAPNEKVGFGFVCETSVAFDSDVVGLSLVGALNENSGLVCTAGSAAVLVDFPALPKENGAGLEAAVAFSSELLLAVSMIGALVIGALVTG